MGLAATDGTVRVLPLPKSMLQVLLVFVMLPFLRFSRRVQFTNMYTLKDYLGGEGGACTFSVEFGTVAD